ncbi:MAG: efflux RND transporter periplasmic adaptor subunit, partial [Candidatus Obscuribacterales bacterium]|nr:efflux RND transporter periplasmic adaptor subunit [Candidatus Obscuribacterales bacterium]
IGHQSAAAKQAKATTEYATTYLKYTRIVAQDDGVVTKRLISPGVTVNAGTMILKIAHIKQVRVQAQVASEDEEKIRLGNSVFIKLSERSNAELQARVTSIFPAADPSSRTFTIEALINNVIPGAERYHFLPGQYVIMRISTGKKRGLVIPTNAVVWREGKAQVWKAIGNREPGKATQYTCTMHPEVISDKPGKCPKCGMDLVPKAVGGKQVAELVDIQTGISNPDKTEVVSGLQEGEQVIFAGYANLQLGTPVVGVEWGPAGPKTLPLASEVLGNRLDASNNWTYSQMHGNLMIDVSLSSARANANSIIVKVSKHGGGGISGARVNIKTSMPGMNMPGPDLNGTTNGRGELALTSNFMSGLWQIKISIAAPGQAPIETTVDVEVP